MMVIYFSVVKKTFFNDSVTLGESAIGTVIITSKIPPKKKYGYINF